MSDTQIAWSREKLARFKRDYTKACKNQTRCGTFVFDGHEYVLGYAKYLIQYLEMQFGKFD